ncbi:MAG TPA: AbrB/MazE/SpoVT family DNA-binding domain-containing protein [Candidatus Elarobacter sp.]|jgi:antitoxin component of MazEF toxin-antitoxin module|nr:AbrB/MazE/SpoVT family DNA-binding domain-containing protein [Candidatus Elarobacter sp.]
MDATMMRSKIIRNGTRLAIRLPAILARDLNFRDGDCVTLRSTEHGIVVEKFSDTRLATMLETVSEAEREFGRAVGREIID